jgi:hypothetical protein
LDVPENLINGWPSSSRRGVTCIKHVTFVP